MLGHFGGDWPKHFLMGGSDVTLESLWWVPKRTFIQSWFSGRCLRNFWLTFIAPSSKVDPLTANRLGLWLFFVCILGICWVCPCGLRLLLAPSLCEMMSWVTWGAKVHKSSLELDGWNGGCHFHVVKKGLVKDVIYQKRWVEVMFLQMFACLPLTPTIKCSAQLCSWKRDPSMEGFSNESIAWLLVWNVDDSVGFRKMGP